MRSSPDVPNLDHVASTSLSSASTSARIGCVWESKASHHKCPRSWPSSSVRTWSTSLKAGVGLTRALQKWGITLGEPCVDVSPGNLVYRCTLPDGTPAVIKTEPDRGPEDEFLTGLDALVFYGGRGMVRVLEVARDDRIVLMERVVPGETLWDAPIDTALEAVASVMSKLRGAPAKGHPFPDVRSYHRAWPNHVRLYGGPGPIDADLFE